MKRPFLIVLFLLGCVALFAVDTIKVTAWEKTYIIVVSKITWVELMPIDSHSGTYGFQTVSVHFDGVIASLEVVFQLTSDSHVEASRFFSQLEQAIKASK